MRNITSLRAGVLFVTVLYSIKLIFQKKTLYWIHEWPREAEKSILRKVFEKKPLFEKICNFAKNQYFSMRFFKTISTQSETFISGVFQRLWTISKHFLRWVPIESDSFQIWKKKVVSHVEGVRVLRSLWKPHKSKVLDL